MGVAPGDVKPLFSCNLERNISQERGALGVAVQDFHWSKISVAYSVCGHLVMRSNVLSAAVDGDPDRDLSRCSAD